LLPVDTQGDTVLIGGGRLSLAELKKTEKGIEVPYEGTRPRTVDVEVRSGWAPWTLRYWPLAEPYIAKVRAMVGS